MSIFRYPNLRRWEIVNLDTGSVIQGQFEPENVSRDIAVNYATHTSLNRTVPITQWLNRSPETLSFQARMYNLDSTDTTAEEQLRLLEDLTQRDRTLRRPPVIQFSVGDGFVVMNRAVVLGLAGITYGRPSFFGALREVTLTINLQQFKDFSLEDEEIFETRYHRAKARDYFELLTYREYANPLMGDRIRKRHPSLANLEIADVIKLPSIEAIVTEVVTQESVALKTGFGKRDTDQKQLRQLMFDLRGDSYVSHIVVED